MNDEPSIEDIKLEELEPEQWGGQEPNISIDDENENEQPVVLNEDQLLDQIHNNLSQPYELDGNRHELKDVKEQVPESSQNEDNIEFGDEGWGQEANDIEVDDIQLEENDPLQWTNDNFDIPIDQEIISEDQASNDIKIENESIQHHTEHINPTIQNKDIGNDSGKQVTLDIDHKVEPSINLPDKLKELPGEDKKEDVKSEEDEPEVAEESEDYNESIDPNDI